MADIGERTHVFTDDLHKAMAVKGYGGKPITVVIDQDMLAIFKGEKLTITKIEFCDSCDEFHLIVVPRMVDFDDKHSQN